MVLLLVGLCCSISTIKSQDTIHLTSNKSINFLSKKITVIDNRDYTNELGKIKSFDKDVWKKVELNTPFINSLTYLNDSIASRINLTQEYIINIQSLYVQENRIKGSSMQYGRIAYQADYYIKNKDLTYSKVYTADTSGIVSTYLLPISLAFELKNIFNYAMIKSKNSSSKGPSVTMDDIKQTPKLPEYYNDLFTENRADGLYYTWEQLLKNEPQLSNYKIKGIKNIGQIELQDTLTRKKIKIPLFQLFAYIQNGILYKCTRFGSFTLLNYQHNFYYVGFNESHFTSLPDTYNSKKVKKKGGLTLLPLDIESQRYLFKLNPTNGKSIIICSVTPNDDISKILQQITH
jgi:hypothetical protein